MDLFPNGLKTFFLAWGFHWYPCWRNLSRNVGVVSERTHGQTHGQTNGRTDRQLNKKLLRKKLFLPYFCFLAMDLFPNGLKTFLLAWGFHWYPCWRNLSRIVGVVSGQTHRQTKGRTASLLNKKQLETKNYFCHIFVFWPWICFQMVLKPFSWHEVSIDTSAEQIC